jgi:hypothetical protein
MTAESFMTSMNLSFILATLMVIAFVLIYFVGKDKK